MHTFEIMCSLLTLLPFDVFGSVFSEWIQLSVLCRLDTALCLTGTSRNTFLECLRSTKKLFRIESHYLGLRDCILWVETKHLHLDSLFLFPRKNILTNLHESKKLLTQFKSLDVFHNCGELQQCLTEIIVRCTNLQHVSFCFVEFSSETFFEMFTMSVGSKLQSMEISKFSNHSVRLIGEHCHQLTSLTLLKCSITDENIVFLCKNCFKIRILMLKECNQLTDSGLIDSVACF